MTDSPSIPNATRYTYARTAPAQTIPLRIVTGEGEEAKAAIVPVDFVPGRTVELPSESTVTRALSAAGYLTPIAPSEESEGDEDEGVPLAQQPEGSLDRLRAIETRIDEVPSTGLTADGKPRVAAMSPLVGFQVTAAEIDAATNLREGDRP